MKKSERKAQRKALIDRIRREKEYPNKCFCERPSRGEFIRDDRYRLYDYWLQPDGWGNCKIFKCNICGKECDDIIRIGR